MKHRWLASFRVFAPPVLLALVLGSLAGRAAEAGKGPLVGKRAPSFQAQGIYHETYSLEAFKGHILVMQFGSSW